MNVISAYMLINKAYPSTGGPFTVRFYDETGALIQTDANVPQGGKASCTLLDGTFNSENLYFKGWNPAPDRVVQNMDCYPVYGDYIISHEEIHDSWETICADNGAHYPLGAYKSLVVQQLLPITRGETYTAPRKALEIWNAGAFSFDMVKVAEGEDGSTSTWLSTGVIGYRDHSGYQGNIESSCPMDGFGVTGYYIGTPGIVDWGNSYAKKYLHEYLLPCLPESLQTHIKSVNKCYKGYSLAGQTGSNYNTVTEKTSLDKIWIPSSKELHSKLAAKRGWENVSSCEEGSGIDYTLVYVPTYDLGNTDVEHTIVTRTSFPPGYNTGMSVSNDFIAFNDTLDLDEGKCSVFYMRNNTDYSNTDYSVGRVWCQGGNGYNYKAAYAPFGFCL